MDCYSPDDGVAQISPSAGGRWLAAPVGGLLSNPIDLPHGSSDIVDDGPDDQASVNVLSAILDDCRHGVPDTGGVAVDLIGQVNAGPSAARNRGVAAAETPFVVVLDGDDRLMPTFIERTLPLLAADDSMVASSGWLRTFGGSGLSGPTDRWRRGCVRVT